MSSSFRWLIGGAVGAALASAVAAPAGAESPVAPSWAKPYWAKVVWQYPSGGACPAGTFAYTDSVREWCGACPGDYAWMEPTFGVPNFCYRCDPGYVMDYFPEDADYFCFRCPPGYALAASAGAFSCFPGAGDPGGGLPPVVPSLPPDGGTGTGIYDECIGLLGQRYC